MNSYLIWFENLGMGDVGKVGGKNASLGEMISQLTAQGVSVPGGFATTADAYREFLAHAGLDTRIQDRSCAGGRGAFLGNSGGLAGSLVRRSAGNVFERARRRRRVHCHQARVRLAV
jgi:hypothetical protein